MSLLKLSMSLSMLLFAVSACQSAQVDSSLTTIAFGSCSRQDNDDQLWEEVMANDPDLWIWMGDNIYGDTEDMELMQAKYEEQKSRAGYQALIKDVPVIGIWDDHDYGVNDGGKEYPLRKGSKALMLDFLDVPADDPVYSHDGAYQAYTYGERDRMIKVILLDTRYFRDTLTTDTTGQGRYIPGQGDVLGEAQWQWLEQQLTNSVARLHLIGSSIQVIAEEHGWEKWANLPAARQRLFDLIVSTKARGVFFISGDRHIAEISSMELAGLSYPLYDFTASGLTHTWSEARFEANKHRVGDMIYKKNFGIISFDWSNKDVEITFQVRGEADSLWLEEKIVL